MVSLASMNHVEGFVWDKATKDLILVGTKEEGRASLTLDDLVVTLRARFRDNKWPLVSIDPPPGGVTGKMQPVRFEGGIEQTAFGQALFDADYHLKRLGMGLVKAGLPGFETSWDRSVREVGTDMGTGLRSLNSRLWFYPINPHVVVREGVCVVRGLKVGVFTELLGARIDGREVTDLKGLKNASVEAFVKDVSEQFESLCRVHESFNRLRGLQELVAVSKALEEMVERPDLSWWLKEYMLPKVETTKEVEVLRRRYDGQRGSFEVSGGVHLTALALRLNKGDVQALRDAVLRTRPSVTALTWGFLAAEWVIPLVKMPGEHVLSREELFPMFQQAIFLRNHGRYGEAISVYDVILQADPDYVDAYNNRGGCYDDKNETSRALADFDKALALDPSFAGAYNNRGVIYGKEGDYNRAVADFDKALALNPNLVEAYHNRARIHSDKRDYDRAVADYRKAAELHDVEAQVNLGRCYSVGLGVPSDWAEAVKWWRDAAAKNCAVAQFNLGVCYETGQGVTKDYKEALEWYHRAADLNHVEAQFNLGLAYYKGQDVPKDDLQAAKWYRKAAEQNLAAAQANLGKFYASGRGVVKDVVQAVEWYRKAAEQNLAGAQLELGIAYATGAGVAIDNAEAYKWFLLAALQGNEPARKNIAISKKKMKRKQLAEGQKRADNFRPQQGTVSWSDKNRDDKDMADSNQRRPGGETFSPASLRDLGQASGRQK